MTRPDHHIQPRQSSVDFDEYGSEICRIKIIADDQQSNHVDSSGAEEQEAFILKGTTETLRYIKFHGSKCDLTLQATALLFG